MKKLVLLPGLDGTGLLFQPLLEQLGTDIETQIIAYPRHQPLSVQELAAYVCEKVVLDQDTVLLVESFSGLVAWELLQRGIQPASVIFCASFVSAPRPLLLKLTKILPLRYLFKLAFSDTALAFSRVNPELKPLLRQARLHISTDVLAYRLGLIADAILLLKQQPFQTPGYYLQAANDWAVPSRCIETLRPYFNGLVVEKIDSSGHFLLQTQPAKCADIIKSICQ